MSWAPRRTSCCACGTAPSLHGTRPTSPEHDPHTGDHPHFRVEGLPGCADLPAQLCTRYLRGFLWAHLVLLYIAGHWQWRKGGDTRRVLPLHRRGGGNVEHSARVRHHSLLERAPGTARGHARDLGRAADSNVRTGARLVGSAGDRGGARRAHHDRSGDPSRVLRAVAGLDLGHSRVTRISGRLSRDWLLRGRSRTGDPTRRRNHGLRRGSLGARQRCGLPDLGSPGAGTGAVRTLTAHLLAPGDARCAPVRPEPYRALGQPERVASVRRSAAAVVAARAGRLLPLCACAGHPGAFLRNGTYRLSTTERQTAPILKGASAVRPGAYGLYLPDLPGA